MDLNPGIPQGVSRVGSVPAGRGVGCDGAAALEPGGSRVDLDGGAER
jgi:hypothetical protein